MGMSGSASFHRVRKWYWQVAEKLSSETLLKAGFSIGELALRSQIF
jgi:hypothetical protein